MLTQEIQKDVVAKQRQFFHTGATQDLSFRRKQLLRLKQTILDHQEAIIEALNLDLRKPAFESLGAEVLFCINEIDYALKHLKQWTKPKRVSTPLIQFPASAKIIPDPLGVVLIIAPWNYPIQLAFSPLVGAIAAGNCAIIKPSEMAIHSSSLMSKMIAEAFDPDYITVVEGDKEVAKQLLQKKFDHIFFTGSPSIGKRVMEAAAQHLTPVTLELGGKNPCIVTDDAVIEQAAKQITWGKFLNAGQVCIAPDYLLVHSSIKEELITKLKSCITTYYGDDPSTSPDYPRIIHNQHFERLCQLLSQGEILTGGQTNSAERYIAPTLIQGVDWNTPIMQEEIFGPILPILEYEDLESIISLIKSQPKPLALYIFSKSAATQNKILQATSSGGVAINDTVAQVASPYLPFGGVGQSGIGSYHGKASFDTFSHHKSVFKRPTWFKSGFLHPPYTDSKVKFLQVLMK